MKQYSSEITDLVLNDQHINLPWYLIKKIIYCIVYVNCRLYVCTRAMARCVSSSILFTEQSVARHQLNIEPHMSYTVFNTDTKERR